MSVLQKNCAACSALISVRLADHKRGWGRFCDKSCAAAYKCGYRPRDVRPHHSPWADAALRVRKACGVSSWPVAPTVQDQLGHSVKVKPLLHSPRPKRACRRCDDLAVDGSLYCIFHEVEDDDTHPGSEDAVQPGGY